jgi:dinuclear metal center YbgI/SA1388 family protein
MSEVNRQQLQEYLDQYLEIKLFEDYGPNGLQIEGCQTIKKIAFAVSATKDSIEKAIQLQAQALIVHHGLFWNFHGVRTITGPFSRRVRPLIENHINLFGYHLPLDGHPVCGNAAQLATQCGLENLQPFGKTKGLGHSGIKGEFSTPINANELKKRLEVITNHPVLHAVAPGQLIKSLGIITGGANGGWLEASRCGLDAYLTGEMSEHDWHEASECGIHMFAAGHHATEQFGIQALMQVIQNHFSVATVYIDSENPA